MRIRDAWNNAHPLRTCARIWPLATDTRLSAGDALREAAEGRPSRPSPPRRNRRRRRRRTPRSIGWTRRPPGTVAAGRAHRVRPRIGRRRVGQPAEVLEPAADRRRKGGRRRSLCVPLTAVAPLAATKAVVRIKVPAGLDDPRPYHPPPPTRRRWTSGNSAAASSTTRPARRRGRSSRAPPATTRRTGFADNGLGHNGVNTPTLVNCVFNRRQFWDGRVAALEEVVQRTVAGRNRPPAKDSRPFRHVWSGVVRRLRANADYTQLFLNAFGTPPTAGRRRQGAGDVPAHAAGRRLRLRPRRPRPGRRTRRRARSAAHYEKALDDAAP